MIEHRRGLLAEPIALVDYLAVEEVDSARLAVSDAAYRLTAPARITVGKTVGLHYAWFVYRGAGDVTFDPIQVKVWEDTRAGGNSPWAPLWVPPAIPADGRWVVRATFDAPGEYLVRAQADNWRAPDSDTTCALFRARFQKAVHSPSPTRYSVSVVPRPGSSVRVNAIRTGAVCGLATALLATDNASTLAMLGAGAFSPDLQMAATLFEQGRFQLDSLPPGILVVQVQHPALDSIGPDIPLAIHSHNDFELGTAGQLAALEGGCQVPIAALVAPLCCATC